MTSCHPHEMASAKTPHPRRRSIAWNQCAEFDTSSWHEAFSGCLLAPTRSPRQWSMTEDRLEKNKLRVSPTPYGHALFPQSPSASLCTSAGLQSPWRPVRRSIIVMETRCVRGAVSRDSLRRYCETLAGTATAFINYPGLIYLSLSFYLSEVVFIALRDGDPVRP